MPFTDLIWSVVHPASASFRAAVLRTPCSAQSSHDAEIAAKRAKLKAIALQTIKSTAARNAERVDDRTCVRTLQRADHRPLKRSRNLREKRKRCFMQVRGYLGLSRSPAVWVRRQGTRQYRCYIDVGRVAHSHAL